MPRLFLAVAALLALALAVPRPAGAYIERMYALSEILGECTHVLVAVVDSVDVGKQRAVFRVVEDLKGKSGWKKINVNYAVGQFDHPALMMKRLAPGLPALMFYKAEGSSFAAETHVFGSWFQTHTEDGPERDKVWWNFTHIEIHLQRTYAGSTPAFIQLVRDVLAKRKAAPAPNPKQASGPGPELPAQIPAAELYGGKPVVAATPKPAPRPVGPPPIPTAAGPIRTEAFFTREITLGSLPGPVMGVSWIDFDADGDADALACSTAGTRLFRNDGPAGEEHRFADVTTDVGLGPGMDGASWADANGDGTPDMLTTDGRLFRLSGGKFTESSPLADALRKKRAAPPSPVPTRAAWLDVNGDARPDIVAVRPGGVDVVLNGPAGFAAAPPVALPAAAGPPFGFLTVADVNADNRPDLLSASEQPQLLKNLATGLAAVTCPPGAQVAGDWPVGLAAGDLDNDGLPELFVPGRQGGRLFRNRGRGAFEDVTAASPDLAALTTPIRAGCWFDANGDGCLDLYVSREQGPGAVFLNDRTGRLHDRTQVTAMAQRGPGGGAAGVAAADFDRDGDQDLLMGSRSGRVLVQVNALQRPTTHAFVQVRLVGPGAGVGAHAEFRSVAGKLLARRLVGAADNYGSQGEAVAFFAARPGAYSVHVTLPGGGPPLVQALDVPAEGVRVDVRLKASADRAGLRIGRSRRE